eukprot:Hpha_TRINITY_DN31936_c0_g1::TRINITY_DN31936_c0_g1_i1::g.21940::m.21940
MPLCGVSKRCECPPGETDGEVKGVLGTLVARCGAGSALRHALHVISRGEEEGEELAPGSQVEMPPLCYDTIVEMLLQEPHPVDALRAMVNALQAGFGADTYNAAIKHEPQGQNRTEAHSRAVPRHSDPRAGPRRASAAAGSRGGAGHSPTARAAIGSRQFSGVPSGLGARQFSGGSEGRRKPLGAGKPKPPAALAPPKAKPTSAGGGQAPERKSSIRRMSIGDSAPATAKELEAAGVLGEVEQGSGGELSKIEKEVLEALNQVRSNPASLIPMIEEELRNFEGNSLTIPGSPVHILTQEGPAAWHEAIQFLRQQPRVGVLELKLGLCMACRDHCRDHGAKGTTGHAGSDGSTPGERTKRYGKWLGKVGENIQYGGSPSGRDIVKQLIIDDGVPGR